MPHIWFGYGATTVEDCEDVWSTDVGGGAVTIAQEGTIKKVGTYSVKITVDQATTGVVAYEDFGAMDLTGKTHVAFWIRCSSTVAAGKFTFLIDNTSKCASPYGTIEVPAMTADVWYRVIGAVTGTSGTVSVALNALSTTGTYDIYIDDVIALSAKEYDLLTIRGLDDVDEVISNPSFTVRTLDGSYFEVLPQSFNRRISVSLGAVAAKADRTWLYTFLKQSTKRIIKDEATCDDVLVVWEIPENGMLVSTWLDDVSHFRAYDLVFLEKTARTTNPDSWS